MSSRTLGSSFLVSVLPLFLLVDPLWGAPLAQSDARAPIVDKDVVHLEKDGLLAVEAEHFSRQTKTDVRAFYLTTLDARPELNPDGDPPHVGGASGGAYLEILPDTRRTHADRLIRGENFSPKPGGLAVLDYRVHIQTPGRYWVWVRAYSTGSEDNGLHVGLDGEWPASGQRLQWCQGKRSWRWESKQRTEKVHCGEPHKIWLDIEEAGEHTISFSMREDGFEFDKWLMTRDREFPRPDGVGPVSVLAEGKLPDPFPLVEAPTREVENKPREVENTPRRSPTRPVSDLPLVLPRQKDGSGEVVISGEQRVWHDVTLTLDGPWAHEQDNQPNPFTDLELNVVFQHVSGEPVHRVPGYFAADGQAAESSAESGTKWRAHLAPEKDGEWQYSIEFWSGKTLVNGSTAERLPVKPYHGKSGSFRVEASDKTGRDLRGKGRLQYVGKRYLRFAGDGEWFLKAGADAPETLLAYADFDGTVAGKPKKVPLKTWSPHLRDWRDGDPTWKGGKGKGLIGAINYLSGKGCNAFSFLTYNAGGDGDNVWPFIHRDDKLHYDCSKLDQWGIVFAHGTARGMYLHFKMQETEMDDDNVHRKGRRSVPTSLDGGALGVQRRLYCRELVARFGHNLALNWNLGEENTQSTSEQLAMADFLREVDPWDHSIVVHTFPGQQDKIYRPLLGPKSPMTGASLQNSHISQTHVQTVKWVRESTRSGKPWVVAFDESGSAAHGQCPDLGWGAKDGEGGFDGRDRSGKMVYTEHDVRRQTLWGTLMGGGAGVEYYFGYQFAENDLRCEDWRSRDRSWDYCRIALEFFRDEKIPFWMMEPADELVGNAEHDNRRYCLAQKGEAYLVYLPESDEARLDLSEAEGSFDIRWFQPQVGGELTRGSVDSVQGGGEVSIGRPGEGPDDWLAVVRRRA